MDSHYVFHYLYETRTDKGGSWERDRLFQREGGTRLTKAMNREIDLGKRAGMVAKCGRLLQDDVVPPADPPPDAELGDEGTTSRLPGAVGELSYALC